MQVSLDSDDLRPVVETVVSQILAEMVPFESKITNRLALTEAEAASALGIERHCLRDCRLRGEITASRVGRKILYTPEALREFLNKQRT